ncbi:hypothetical protein ACFFWD_23085 [Bradyrhizobium erythrophlei]|uniref:hypothetical protein n=1 Tax=Bradyrhizobium erythrophlei TaxID=1437360 RepID=UPI0035EB67D9
MGKVTKQRSGPDRPKLRERRGKLAASGNARLPEQIRKILRKHYASKYRVR